MRWSESADAVVTLLLDDPAQRVNTMSVTFAEALIEAIERLEREQDRIAGVIIRSGKKSFLAGGDLNRLLAATPAGLGEFVTDLNRRKSYYRRLERLGKPVVALIDGPALGGGLEFALCCHHRIGVDNGRTTVGLPEVGLGLLPGAGGVVRTVRRLGLERALDEVLLPGRPIPLADAIRLGLVDASAPSAEAAEALARSWIAAPPAPLPRTPESAPAAAGPRPLPADRANRARELLTQVAWQSLELGIDEALAAESAAFASLVVDPGAKNCVRTHFFATTALRRQVAAPAGGTPVADVATWDRDDYVGDGQRVVECEMASGDETERGVAALAKAGAVVVRLRQGAGSFGDVVQEAIAAALAEQVAAGQPADRIAHAAYWAGLSRTRPATISAGAPDADLVRAVLDRVAETAAEAAPRILHDPDDVDIASVRAGGFPGWTGGVRHWLREGKALLPELIEQRTSERTG